MDTANVTLLGRAGADAELRMTPGGSAVAEFSLAVNTGKKGEPATWFRISVWGKQGDKAAEYVKKGQQVLVIGALNIRQYQAKDGSKGYSFDVSASHWQMVGGRPGDAVRVDSADEIPF